MANKKWSDLNNLQIGRYGEYLAKMEFASYGFEVYTSEVDDHGVDFIAKNEKNGIFEVQVKAFKNDNYVFIKESKMSIESDIPRLVCLIHLEENKDPDIFVFSTKVWDENLQSGKYKTAFVKRDYVGKKSKPEYGINTSKKNLILLREQGLSADIALPKLLK